MLHPPNGPEPESSLRTDRRTVLVEISGHNQAMIGVREEEGVYVLHACEKRTRKTPQSEIALAQKRLGDLIRSRAKKKSEAP